MKNSLLIVSTYEGSITDIVFSSIHGFLVPQKDIQALVMKLEILTNNPECDPSDLAGHLAC